MTTTPTLIQPASVTADDVRQAAYVLGQVLAANADSLPFSALTEGWSVRLLLDQLAPPVAIPPAPRVEKIDPDDVMAVWLASIVERSADRPVSIRAGWLLSATKRVAGLTFPDVLAVELAGELAETRPRLSFGLAGLLETLKGLPKR